MALSPFRNLLGLTPDHRQLNRYRRQLVAEYKPPQHERQLPLLLRSCDSGAVRHPNEVLGDITRLAILSERPELRILALEQMCLRWALGQSSTEHNIPLFLRLNDYVDPEKLLAGAARQAGFSSELLALRRSLASNQWLLILSGISELGPQSYERARSWARDLLTRFPALSVVLTLAPADREDWPQLSYWEVVDPSIGH